MIKHKKIKISAFLILTGMHFAFAQTWNYTGVFERANPQNMLVYNNKLYTGTNKLSPSRLISFDGQQWDSTTVGINGVATVFELYQNKLLLAGIFGDVGGLVNTGAIASWDGSQFNSIGSNGAFGIFCMTVYKNELYVGGNFTTIGGVNVNRIAKWDGTQWKDVGDGVKGGITYINAMEVYKGELYVGGSFFFAGTDTAYNIAKWDGTNWYRLPGYGTNGDVSSMVVDTAKDILYVGGGFTHICGTNVWAVGSFDGNQWTSPGGQGITCGALAMCMYNNDLYVGGPNCTFPISPNDTILARFDGTNWYPIKGPNYRVLSLAVYNNNLYVGGDFTSVNGDTSIKSLACYGTTCPQNVGIKEENKKEIAFTIFPNPVKQQVNIKIENIENKDYSFQIVDVLGKIIQQGKIKSETIINTENYSKGIYSVNICDEAGKCSSQKMVVE